MRIGKKIGFFTLGGSSYVLLELLWRGYSHISMFAAGGLCFLLLGRLSRLSVPTAVQTGLGACSITAVELLTGLIVNRGYQIWDYRDQPGNVLGQICPLFTLLWLPVAYGGICLYRITENQIHRLQQK